ncbi:hypothetical protein WR25_25912 [Diploscapter pachys]|uniref:ABC transporter domain-containing protein n=1 Tax=Diploscapter pachys TaxID=2018661 RepID=A0A2A2K7C0_9BILA|nr:hypothetical protein WR25_25912 [Diploscapter pachys]
MADPRAVEHAGEVDRHRPVDLVEARRRDRPACADTGIVEQDVEPPTADAREAVEVRRPRIAIAHVHHIALVPLARQRRQRLGKAARIDVGHADQPAAAREQPPDRAADTRSATGDEDRLPLAHLALPIGLCIRHPASSAPMPAESLRFDAVTKRFDDTVAVDGVSATIPAGQFVALVGASGSGKSTLLKTVNRLVEPSDGRVLIDDADVATRAAPALRRSIGYVFQSIGLFPHMTVAENIAIGPRIAGGPPVDVPALLDLVALPRELAGRRPYALSGGQRQRRSARSTR